MHQKNFRIFKKIQNGNFKWIFVGPIFKDGDKFFVLLVVFFHRWKKLNFPQMMETDFYRKKQKFKMIKVNKQNYAIWNDFLLLRLSKRFWSLYQTNFELLTINFWQNYLIASKVLLCWAHFLKTKFTCDLVL